MMPAIAGKAARRLPSTRLSPAISTPESSAMLLPEMTITWVVPVALNASATSSGMPLSMPRSIPFASAAAGSGRTRSSSADPRAFNPYSSAQNGLP